MIWILALLASTVPGDLIVDGPPPEWLAENAPNGFDITLDGIIWLNVGAPGRIDDYALRANDVYLAATNRSIYPKAWVRGYHLRNRKLPYRESKRQISIDCQRQTMTNLYTVYYKADGSALFTEGQRATVPVVPGTYDEAYMKRLCPK